MATTRLPLPAYAKPDLWLDDENAIEFVRWKDDPEPYMAHWWHRRAIPDGREWCLGAFQWRKPDERILGPLWDLVSLDPLTVSPSLLCGCGAHGFIRDGRWLPV